MCYIHRVKRPLSAYVFDVLVILAVVFFSVSFWSWVAWKLLHYR